MQPLLTTPTPRAPSVRPQVSPGIPTHAHGHGPSPSPPFSVSHQKKKKLALHALPPSCSLSTQAQAPPPAAPPLPSRRYVRRAVFSANAHLRACRSGAKASPRAGNDEKGARLLSPSPRPSTPLLSLSSPPTTHPPTHSTALVAALAAVAAALVTSPPPAAAAGKVQIRNPKVKVEKESRATLLARAKAERLADLRAKAGAAREGGGGKGGPVLGI